MTRYQRLVTAGVCVTAICSSRTVLPPGCANRRVPSPSSTGVTHQHFVLLYLGVRKRLGRQEDAFDLGRFDIPVAIGALVWSVVVVFVLVSPPGALTAVLISVGVLLAGGVYLAYLLMFNREVLETEPGDVSVFTH